MEIQQIENKQNYFTINNKKNKIILMLDIDGVLNNLDEKKVQLFFQIINQLRIKFEADEAVIFLSSHVYDADALKPYLDFFNQHLISNITIGKSFYLFGKYDYYSNSNEYFGITYNLNKTAIFEKEYLNDTSINIKWFAIIDDYINTNYYKQFKNNKLMTTLRPSQNSCDEKDENIMCHSTITKGFDGVLELLNIYYNEIKNKSIKQIFEEQISFLPYLSSYEISKLLYEKNYNLLIQYLQEDKIDKQYYSLIDNSINLLLKENNLPNEIQKLQYIKKLVQPPLISNKIYLFNKNINSFLD